MMWGNPTKVQNFIEFPEGGGYPIRFPEWAFAEMSRVSGKSCDHRKVLHLCSGSMRTGIRVDIRPETEPTILADCRDTGLPDESFDFIMADPPYSKEYASQLYDTEEAYPRPGQIVREAMRLLRPEGLFGLLHFQVPQIKKPAQIVGVYGITTGCGYQIRAWTLIRKLS